MDFPIIHIPPGLEEIATNGKTLKKPTQPVFDAKEPEFIEAEEGCLYTLAMFLAFSCGFLVIIGTIGSIAEGESPGGVFVPALIIFLFSLLIIKNHSNQKKENLEKFKKNVETFRNKKEKFNEEMHNYEIKLQTFSKKFQRKYLISHEKYVKESLLEYYSEIIKPKKINISVKEGKTEQNFYETLETFFGAKIKKNVALINDHFSQNSIPYVPDIVYNNIESGICIDIEIDEKYTSDGQLIHYEFSPHDYERNQFFSNHNWIIIRFSEKQILEDKLGCVVTILKTIQKFDPSFRTQDLHYTLLSENEEVSKMEQWKNSVDKSENDNLKLGDIDDDLPF